MKKMMKVLAMTLIAMMALSTAAMAEMTDFQAANTDDEYTYEAPTAPAEAPVYGDPGAAPSTAASDVPPVPRPEAPAPVPMADYADLDALQQSLGLAGDAGVIDIEEDLVPLGAGPDGLFVEIAANVAVPQYGEDVTLRSFVVNQGGLPLSYQWQIDRGQGWEDIRDANGTEFTFNYNETVSGCSFRLSVEPLAI